MWNLFKREQPDWESSYRIQSRRVDDALKAMINAKVLLGFVLEGDEVDEATLESIEAFIKDAMDTLDET